MWLLCMALVAAQAEAVEPATPPVDPAKVEALIRELREGGSAEARAAAAKELGETRSASALPALEQAARDESPQVRSAAVTALSLVAIANEVEAMPPVLLELLVDEDPEVRSTASFAFGLYKTYPEGTREALLKALEHEEPDVRATAAATLPGIVTAEDEPVLSALKDRLADPELEARSPAAHALYRMTGDASLVVPVVLRISQKVGFDPPRDDREQTQQNLFAISAAKLMLQMSEEHPRETAQALLAEVADEDPVVRGSAARIVGAVANQNEEARRAVRELGAEEVLLRLRDDPGEEDSVVGNAAYGLRMLRGEIPPLKSDSIRRPACES